VSATHSRVAAGETGATGAETYTRSGGSGRRPRRNEPMLLHLLTFLGETISYSERVEPRHRFPRILRTFYALQPEPERHLMTHQALATFRLADGTCIAQAQPQRRAQVTLESPAMSVMTDLTEVRAATAPSGISLDQAEATMIQQGVRLLFVVDQMPCVEGIVTADALRGDKPMRLIHQRNVRRDELVVADVMSKLSDLDMVDFGTLERASVGSVAATLKKFGRPHLLVVERATAQNGPRIRGLVSHSQLERQLGTSLPILEIATTFIEIEMALT